MTNLVKSITVNWLKSDIIDVEVDINNGLPNFIIVWLPDQWVQESRERIKSALKAIWAKLPKWRIVINLAPADIRKTGPSFDLPMAVWILYKSEFIYDSSLIKDSVFIWELGLDWWVRKIPSVLPATIWAKEKWYKKIFVPKENAKEASIIPWIDIIWIENLKDLTRMLNWDKDLDIQPPIDFKSLQIDEIQKFDFHYIIWQENAKRALEIAAAWGHNIIMNGPPGSWKTLLAKTFSTILPDLDIDESIEVSKIYSISGMLNSENPIIFKRPFRTVHHTASWASIIGWWRNASPWEISLAHKWVLFLDELLEFNKNILEVLRQPLEDWEITVNRVNASYTYPSKFILLGAMNPCPCGFLSDPDKECSCSNFQVQNYNAKLSGPLLDRMDMFIEVPRLDIEELDIKKWFEHIETSAKIKSRVEKARNLQKARLKFHWISTNSEMQSKLIKKYCCLEEDADDILKRATTNMNLSSRSYFRILKLSRTIADLNDEKNITSSHILEALSYRKQESN